ncbi:MULTISPECIES: hypothetical protein [unclassified Nocardia]|uniref:hypothetical protein n=1 Tax=unclassified Nocardia TaxID=2637762 RepID=UPI0024A91661|nr:MULTISPECIES: hypothetical protein [unclassified Nocardia]
MNPATPTRLLGLATAVYGLAVAIRPEIMLHPAGLGTDEEPELRPLARLIALRDLASGLVMAGATDPRARRAATAIRVASDTADTVVLARALRGRPERPNTLLVTSGWGLLCAVSAGYERWGAGRRASVGNDAVR